MKVLFVCKENTCRSIMAETVFNSLSQGKHIAFSAGFSAGGELDRTALDLLKERGYKPRIKNPLSIEKINLEKYDLVITVCEEMECVFIPHKNVERWNMKDPKGKSKEEYLKTLEIIEKKVKELIRRIENESS